jgi:acetyl-CoA C-acetyltransferase
MSQAPYLHKSARWGRKYGDAVLLDAIQHDGLRDPLYDVAMGETAERIAEKYDIDRAAQDHYALISQQRAVAALPLFAREIALIQCAQTALDRDEHPRADTTLDKLSRLRPAFREKGTLNASGLNDGAAALLLCNARVLAERGWKSRAHIVGARTVGCDPLMMGLGAIAAIRTLCDDIGWNLHQVDAVEIQ